MNTFPNIVGTQRPINSLLCTHSSPCWLNTVYVKPQVTRVLWREAGVSKEAAERTREPWSTVHMAFRTDLISKEINSPGGNVDITEPSFLKKADGRFFTPPLPFMEEIHGSGEQININCLIRFHLRPRAELYKISSCCFNIQPYGRWILKGAWLLSAITIIIFRHAKNTQYQWSKNIVFTGEVLKWRSKLILFVCLFLFYQ